ncbi:hypothetical protein [Methanobrevibacter wolinii]|uniref:hypothetical protein n=1 Tax=Methanobrevibacter wolinii TaxID=190977 RepID=UPI0005B2D86C|nr:hypothetical protein [Methanobrevibacter wolinii]
MVTIKQRLTININKKYYSLYQDIIDNTEWGNRNNLKLFTITVLIGKYIVNKSMPITNNSHPYLRVRDNDQKEDMTILKCFAILESGDINILKDEDKMFTICENYTTAGIIELTKWYKSNEEDIILKLSDILEDKFNKNIKDYFDQ